MTQANLTIRKYAYLKTVKYSVTHNNEQGGSFKSGEQSSVKQVRSHILFTFRHLAGQHDLPVIIETWTDFDANDEPIMTVEHTTLGEFMAPLVASVR